MNIEHRVVVLGAGYAGLTAATRLARRVDTARVSVTLVNARDGFVQRPRLHQAATGQTPPSPALDGLLAGTGVDFVLGWADRIDTGARTVEVATADGCRELGYDTLVYALGSRVDTTTVPGIREHAHVLDPATTPALAAAVGETGTLVVVGGGLTGIEAATEFAESRPGLTVKLVSRGEPGGWLSAGAKKHIDKAFARLGIEIIAGNAATEITEGTVRLDDGTTVDFDACVWAGGFDVPELAAESGLAVDRAGRALVDDRLRSVSHPEIHVIGDAAALAGTWGDALAYGCRVGGFQGPYIADALARLIGGEEPEAFTFRHIHQCVSLGRKDAVIQFVHAGDESARDAVLRGRVAVWYKDLVLNSAMFLFGHPGPYLPHRRIRPAAALAHR
ncbi:NAD(P)/FAD-dependent oxidoreductase [Phytomonospora endophytica]|uniref:NADH dehydrogenase FAD-containing subunit n=1 Tax=Phytomonospora endophytica TaxID=714109 RepID=A0A841FV92_9ACTN|nr:FAD-dependent oxidoreductase [Phytomonospora endophytica]MBB6035900.1 NADH dehydrogenase FAD-containing subunit [Phytomonospora endophytica]GIG71104.1 oxidoreductase [Phytomonospora endophytica]